MIPGTGGLWAVPLLNHLWQSTMFAGGAWLLALVLRRNPARMRFRLWLAASLKFLIPFSLLIAAGAHLTWPPHPERTRPAVATAVEVVAQPLLQPWPTDHRANFAVSVGSSSAEHDWRDRLSLLLLGVWMSGTLLLFARWTTNWLRLRSAVRRGEAIALADGTVALLVTENVEPGVFGIARPVLVLPSGITSRLTADQLAAIVAHEQCHIRRRDNFTAALHMLVEALFWINPVVWWVGARLVDERERACDEAVLELTREPYAYAEAIVNVCRFFAKAPVSCVSGVTGSDLKHRIARILSGQSVRQLDLRRKVLLGLACLVAAGIPVTAGLVHPAQGQTQSDTNKSSIAGSWQGRMRGRDGRDMRVLLKITKDEKSGLSATLYSIDQNEPPMTGASVRFDGGNLQFVNDFPGLKYEGKMSADGNSISGTATEAGDSMPLVLERATPETEWATPASPPRIAPMAPEAKPGIEVSTVRPTQPGSSLFMLMMRGGNLEVKNLSLNSLMKFAYEGRHFTGGPGWMDTDKWDIEVKPDTPGTPSLGQMKLILQRVLAERFGLKTHEEKREMMGYVLAVGKSGPEMTKTADASSSPNFRMGPLGVVHARSVTMDDLARLLQSNVLSRSVVNETGLAGRWDFVLQWTPDETQFAGAPVKVPLPVSNDANAPPPLFTAIQEQLDLKLEAQKMQVPVLIIDHVERPSPN